MDKVYRVFGAKSLYSNEGGLWEADDSFSGHYSGIVVVLALDWYRVWAWYAFGHRGNMTVAEPKTPPVHTIARVRSIGSVSIQEGERRLASW